MKEILYTIAIDSKGNLSTAQAAKKGVQYNCTNCKNVLILKKSGKIGPRTKRPHFAHKSLIPNCRPETALHYGFKTLATEKLNEYIKTGARFDFNWRCEYCGEQHIGNYTKKLKSVKVEYDLKHCRPDIALLDNNDLVFAVIEVVVTNKPSERVLNYYLENKIILIQINLKSDDNIYQIEEKLTKPNLVNFCINPQCKACNNFQKKYIFTIIDGNCSKCYNSMKVAAVKNTSNKFLFGPEKFDADEIAHARKMGIMIDEFQNTYTGEKYHANQCGNCGSFIKKYNKLKDYFSYAVDERFPMTDYYIKYHCSHCAEKKISDDDNWVQNLKW